MIASMSGPSSRVQSNCPESFVVPTPSTCTPSWSNNRGIVGNVKPTPIEPVNVEGLAQISGLADNEIPLVRLPGGPELRNPSAGEVSRALGIGLELDEVETVDLLVVGGGPAGLGAAVYGASEGLETLVVEGSALGGQAGTSRRI